MTNFLLNNCGLIKKPKNLLLVIFIFQALLLSGQELSYIFGKVVDAKTGSPLAFASIVQKDKSVGLISNDDGSFKLPKYFDVAKVTIVVSFIGYYSEEVKVSTMKKDDLNIIKLVEKTESLNEIVIKSNKKTTSLSPYQIVERAVGNIKNNYPLDPYTYVGYYRDYQKNNENDYVNLNEAILQVHDRGFRYKDYTTTNTSIFKYSSNKDFPINESAAGLYDYNKRTKVIDRVKLGYLSDNSNEFVLLRIHDAIRNYNINTYDYVNNLETDFIRNHNFILIRETSVKNINLYEIRVFREIDNMYAEGKIFISKDDYKIYKFQYSVFEKVSRKTGSSNHSYMDTAGLLKKKTKLIFNVILEYTDYNEIMYPKYISFKNPFEVMQSPKFVPLSSSFGHTGSSSDAIFYLDILFNNEVASGRANKKRNYKIGYKGDRIKIDSIKLMGNTVRVYPRDKDMIYAKQAWLKGMGLSGDDFSLDVKNIKDVDGNVVFKNEKGTFMQYREFFIQELNTNTERPKDVTNMTKNRPLYQNQPIKAPKDISKYWMNTPLKE